MLATDVEVRESQIEDILVASPDLLKDLLRLSDLPRILSRQMPIPSGRLDLLMTSSSTMQLVELKVVPFHKLHLEQILRYEKDVRCLQEAGRLIHGDLGLFLLCTSATLEQKKLAAANHVTSIVYDPSQVLRHYYQHNKPIAMFTDTRPIDIGIWNLHLIHDLLNAVISQHAVSKIGKKLGGSRKTLYNKIRFARELRLVDWEPNREVVALTELGREYLQRMDSASSAAISEAQAELVRGVILKNPFESSVILGIASVVEAVFVVAKNTHPVPMNHLIEYFAYHCGKFFDWAKPKARYNATHMYVNYGITLGLLARIGESIYLTPNGYRFTLHLQLYKGLRMVEAL
jgi:hypothetical protein